MLILIRTFILSNFIWVLLASSVASGFAGGYAVRTWYQASLASELRQIQEKAAQDRKKANELSKDLEKLLADERGNRIKIEGKLRDELKAPAYTACVVPPSGVQLLRDALGKPTPQPHR